MQQVKKSGQKQVQRENKQAIKDVSKEKHYYNYWKIGGKRKAWL